MIGGVRAACAAVVVLAVGACVPGSSSTSGSTSTFGSGGCGDGVCSAGESCASDCGSFVDYDGSLDGCSAGVSQSELDATLIVVTNTADSYHEMVACGGLAMDLTVSLVQVVASAVADAADVEIPGAYEYAGDGRYVTASSGTTMTVEYLLGGDYQLGNEDDVVPYDLFEWSNYLAGASVSVDELHQELEISYDAAGPLVELLGFGANPPNPLVVDLANVYTIGAPIERLKMRASVDVVDGQGANTVTYALQSDPRRLSPLLADGAIDYDLIAAETRGTADHLTTTSWGVGYNDVAGALNGEIEFQVRGGAVPVDGTFTYAGSTYPTITLACGVE
jgi:hypothetical protein